MTATMRLREPRELLAWIPCQLGFHPRDSLVAVSLRGAAGVVGLVVRTDLEEFADPVDGHRVARSLMAHVCGDGGTRVVVVAYSARVPRDVLSGAGGVGHALSLALRAGRDLVGPSVGWVVGPDGYFAWPEEGSEVRVMPARDLESTVVRARMAWEGAVVAPSREQVVVLPVVPAERRRSARLAMLRRDAARRSALAGGGIRDWRTVGVAEWRQAMRGAAGDVWPSAPACGRLAAGLEDVAVRDAVLLSVLPAPTRSGQRRAGGARGPETDETGPSPEEAVRRAVAAVVDPRHAVRPDPAVLGPAEALLSVVAAHLPASRRAPACAVLALLAWWRGDGVRAAVLVERATAADAGHSLATLVGRAVRSGLGPGWTRRPAPEPHR